jgi:asparagine synthase (glutamine-hydrolysing)
LRRQMACTPLPSHFPHENRYPYLDRALLEFLFAVPREQLVRPGERRSLMRRALIGIVPSELLNRRRKAFACQSVLDQIRENWSEFIAMNRDMATAEIGVVEPDQLLSALKRGIQDGQISIVSVMRTLTLECWLRSLRTKGVAQGRANCSARSPLMKFEASAS